ncbi:sugar phosphate isomerase/epimerase family protein [Fictibacillus terranigra]|uniref:Sugar phosphate isomerase/epimerase n=1 Tax=Fictibacillus terranigra TaxID=3058424 RepID=A0ABT8E8S2_9BACL|nr:sugar phosphate isomerase/epimerase [Fictibacillus sp. CENA-BCM004]MDN4074298.1 sugar phosphate isomerase/epimerase [Fictibacillus sp. CENA-BCM004]
MQNRGLQLYTIRELCEKDFIGTLKQVSSWGYKGAQFAGYHDTSAKALKQTLDDYDLKPAGSHIGLDQLKEDELKRQIEYNQILGNDLLVLAYLIEEHRKNIDDYKRVAETLNHAGYLLNREGLNLGYHNHDFEFADHGGETGYDILLNETDPSLVSFELDCYWAAYSGYDPVQFMDRLGERLVTLHMKDMAVKGTEKQSTILGKGELDLESIVKKGNQFSVLWFIVEQEHFEKDLATTAKENARALENLLRS